MLVLIASIPVVFILLLQLFTILILFDGTYNILVCYGGFITSKFVKHGDKASIICYKHDALRLTDYTISSFAKNPYIHLNRPHSYTLIQ